jgi:gliding motility-associated-like protein
MITCRYINFTLMKRILLNIICIIIFAVPSYATHNRAGEITYRYISGLTYEFTVTTYTYTLSPANRSELTFEWGDNTASIAGMDPGYPIPLPDDYRHNSYTARHTFPGPGVYEVLVQDPNRNLGVQNIPNSVNVVFSIKTTILINPNVGSNNSPELLNPPKDRAALGHVFIHNPAAFDIDGDSISYRLTTCTAQNGVPISNYLFPAASDTLYVDEITGDLIWDTPVDTGKYNVAMNIEEWRDGLIIGNIVRDMQIEVFRTNNNPPENPQITDLCVIAGEYIEFTVESKDPDGDMIIHSMEGGPFELSRDSAVFETISSEPGSTTSVFKWQTACSNVRKQPYQIIFESKDTLNDISLINTSTFNITVSGPATEGLYASPTSSDVNLSWEPNICDNIEGYYIYRREGDEDFQQDTCEPYIPEDAGFQKIGEVDGHNNTIFNDDNNGEGLIQGIEYCYVVTAYYSDGSQSIASDHICTALIPGKPAILNASVTESDDTFGEVFLSWAKPRDIDTAAAQGPYVFQILVDSASSGNELIILDSLPSPDLNDTTYYHDTLNTIYYPYYYSVKLYNNTAGNRFEISEGENEIASTIYIDITPDDNQLTLNIKKKVPWIDTSYIVYRYNDITDEFDSVGRTVVSQFIDYNLINGVNYCYKVKSHGWRPIEGIIHENENMSHINCGIPEDLTPPCPPELSVVSWCDSLENILTWTNPNNYCADDVARYKIYFTARIGGDIDSIAGTKPATDTVYHHELAEVMQLGGCYYVTAVDSSGNESELSNMACTDICSYFELPNVFSPNGDGINDKFVAKVPEELIDYIKVEIKIFNRWGQLVFKSNDNPFIEWDGKHMKTKNTVSSGVYYYICDVYEPRIIAEGLQVRNIVGFIHVFSDKSSGQAGE